MFRHSVDNDTIKTSLPLELNLYFHSIWQFSIDDLKAQPNQTTFWDGVRNYQVRSTCQRWSHWNSTRKKVALPTDNLFSLPEGFPFEGLCLFLQVHFVRSQNSCLIASKSKVDPGWVIFCQIIQFFFSLDQPLFPLTPFSKSVLTQILCLVSVQLSVPGLSAKESMCASPIIYASPLYMICCAACLLTANLSLLLSLNEGGWADEFPHTF